jgi:L-iditol 2-dehydrogenase
VGIWACKRADVGVGSRVLIAGAGPIGIILAQTARAFGASEVIVTDVAEDRREFALQHGASQVLDPRVDSAEALNVDAFIDASGAAAAVQAGIMAVRPGGRAILVGMGHDTVDMPVSRIQNREIWVSGVFRYANTWPLGIELVASGKVDLDILVTGRFGLHQVEEALNSGRLPGQLKAIVYPGR